MFKSDVKPKTNKKTNILTFLVTWCEALQVRGDIENKNNKIIFTDCNVVKMAFSHVLVVDMDRCAHRARVKKNRNRSSIHYTLSYVNDLL